MTTGLIMRVNVRTTTICPRIFMVGLPRTTYLERCMALILVLEYVPPPLRLRGRPLFHNNNINNDISSKTRIIGLLNVTALGSIGHTAVCLNSILMPSITRPLDAFVFAPACNFFNLHRACILLLKVGILLVRPSKLNNKLVHSEAARQRFSLALLLRRPSVGTGKYDRPWHHSYDALGAE